MSRAFEQAVNRVLKSLKGIELRSWDDIVLSSLNPTNPAEELFKLAQIAKCYQLFVGKYRGASTEERQEAYQILRIAFDGGVFPIRHHLNREQFGDLLDLHLDQLATDV